jgi:hypothetical protein
VWGLGTFFTWAVDPNGGILDSHLFFYVRYSALAEHYRLTGRIAKADRLAAIAEAYYQAAPDDDGPEAAAIAMPRPRINTRAVSTTRVSKRRVEKPSGFSPTFTLRVEELISAVLRYAPTLGTGTHGASRASVRPTSVKLNPPDFAGGNAEITLNSAQHGAGCVPSFVLDVWRRWKDTPTKKRGLWTR